MTYKIPKRAYKRDLIGRKIVGFELQKAWDEGRQQWLHGWQIELDNGALLFGVVEECDSQSEYGIDLRIRKRERKP